MRPFSFSIFLSLLPPGCVASKLNEKRKEASEMQVAEAKSFLRRTLEEEWPQLSTTPANGDDEMEEED